MSKELRFEDGNVTLGDTLLPGILVSQQIGCAVKIDTAQVEGQAKKTQTPLEWDNASISLCLDLLTDDATDDSVGPQMESMGTDCYQKLFNLNRIFKGKDDGRAQIYRVNSRHTHARGLDQVIFSGLDSDESDQDDVIRVTLTFVEYLPPKQAQQAAGIAGSGTAPATNPGAVASPAAATAVTKDPNPMTSAFSEGFNAGAL